jgi:hypothetical protein
MAQGPFVVALLWAAHLQHPALAAPAHEFESGNAASANFSWAGAEAAEGADDKAAVLPSNQDIARATAAPACDAPDRPPALQVHPADHHTLELVERETPSRSSAKRTVRLERPAAAIGVAPGAGQHRLGDRNTTGGRAYPADGRRGMSRLLLRVWILASVASANHFPRIRALALWTWG